jgi:hypothetical protein
MTSASFSATWLALREPADHRARSASLTHWVAEALPRDRVISVLDLAAGAGSNFRYVSTRLPPRQAWVLADYDPNLLALAGRHADRDVLLHVVDLARLDQHHEIFSGRDLVTASALLDLVSGIWVRAAVARCRDARAQVLLALSYDGRMECEPRDPDDETVRTLVNRHQRTDKGFGPALGPDAVPLAASILREMGYEVKQEQSDWRLTAEERGIQRQLIEGWAEAAADMAPSDADSIAGWRGRRLEHLEAGASRIQVGHEDIAARI